MLKAYQETDSAVRQIVFNLIAFRQLDEAYRALGAYRHLREQRELVAKCRERDREVAKHNTFRIEKKIKDGIEHEIEQRLYDYFEVLCSLTFYDIERVVKIVTPEAFQDAMKAVEQIENIMYDAKLRAVAAAEAMDCTGATDDGEFEDTAGPHDADRYTAEHRRAMHDLEIEIERLTMHAQSASSGYASSSYNVGHGGRGAASSVQSNTTFNSTQGHMGDASGRGRAMSKHYTKVFDDDADVDSQGRVATKSFQFTFKPNVKSSSERIAAVPDRKMLERVVFGEHKRKLADESSPPESPAKKPLLNTNMNAMHNAFASRFKL